MFENQNASVRIRELIARHQAGWSLPQGFYRDPEIYQADVDLFWRRGWLFAGHSCEIPNPGDFFTFTVDADSIVVARNDDHQVHAFHNVCRHRGSLICTESAGNTSRFVCPYHQWTYALDGRLLGWRGMQPDLRKADFSLARVAAHEIGGLIFVSLAAEPQDFKSAGEEFGRFLAPQGLERAAIAAVRDYRVNANWKIIWENNRECFHCNVNHPQYIKANFDHYNADDTSPRIQSELAVAVERSEKKWAADGLTVSRKETGMTPFPSTTNNIWYSLNRTPLVEGYLSETMDGKRVAPLMGDYRDADVGTLRMRALPNFWNHSSCDHSVTTRLLPAGPEATAIRVYWLVEKSAVAGKDYQLAEVLPFWQLTSEQDWEICENQQRGINSTAYRPGPYSTFKEYNVDNFVQWYLNRLRRDLP
jgi:Rieske 2Fe-2S family protein